MNKRNLILLVFLYFLFNLAYASTTNLRRDSLLFYKENAEALKFTDSSKAIAYCKMLISNTDPSNSDEFTFYGYQILGDINKYFGNYSLALENYFAALNNAKELDDLLQVGKIYDQLGRIYLETGSKDQMHESLDKALKIKEELGDNTEYLKTKLILCGYYRKTGNYLLALSIGFEALDYFENESDSTNIALSFNYLALIYKELKNFSKAKQYYHRAKDFYQKENDLRGYSRVINNLGNIELENKNYQEALTYYQKSLDIEKQFNNKFAILTRYNNIGIAYIYLGNFSAAIEKIRYCITEYSKVNSLINLANIYNSLAMCYKEMQKEDSAIIYYNKSIILSKELNLKNLEAKSSLDLSTIYEKKENIQESNKYLKQYNILNDELFSASVTQNVFLKEFEYIQAKNEKLKDAQNRSQNQWFVMVVGFFIILLLAFWIFIIRQRQKLHSSKLIGKELEIKQLKLSDEVQCQNKELISKVLQLVDNESEVQQTIQKLNELKKEAGIAMKGKIQNVINDLEFRMNNNIWIEFDMRFTKVNQDFNNSLITAFPNLTSGEKRLCALLHLNFSTKEIAYITKQTHQSVLVSKSRLRKKMNLSENIKLSEFLDTLVGSQTTIN